MSFQTLHLEQSTIHRIYCKCIPVLAKCIDFFPLTCSCSVFFISAPSPVGLEFRNEMFTAGLKVRDKSEKIYVILSYVLPQSKCATQRNAHITPGQWLSGNK
ncbi:hypothetical protein XENOCAPTIV_012787 [Xenoophorus captivus]|uniref:Uncharacterized protein n=1 Tax=Xenoophorus captivus TaxID=1517983 RepID=A0ABV0QSB7_9TELE